MARAGAAQKALEVAERRKQVAALYLARWRTRQIAAQLGCSHMTVVRDIEAIKAEFQADRQQMIEDDVCALLDMERECAQSYAKGRSREWIAQRLQVMERRQKLLGLDAAARWEIDLKRMTDDELLAALAQAEGGGPEAGTAPGDAE